MIESSLIVHVKICFFTQELKPSIPRLSGALFGGRLTLFGLQHSGTNEAINAQFPVI